MGASGFAYSTGDAYCGRLPMTNLDMDNPLTLSGGTISGNAVCWMVKSSDLPSLVMYYLPLLTTTGAVWFALH
jgi:hypothetical protein